MLIKKITFFLFGIIVISLVFFSCSLTKRVPENQYLLRSNQIIVDNKTIDKEDLNSLIRQQPNRKILGFVRFHLRLYNMSDFGKETKIKNFFKNTIGEPPVIIDTMLTNATLAQQKSYLFNKGFFLANVQKEVVYKKKKADVKYIIKAENPYLINDIKYVIEDSGVERFVYGDSSNRLIKRGMVYDVDVFQEERDRIAKMLKNNAFYNFSREFIFFEMDSLSGQHKINLIVNIKNPVQRSNDSLQTIQKLNHKRFLIHRIYISPQHATSRQASQKIDTTLVKISQRKNKDIFDNYFFIYNSEPRVNPKVITQSVFFKEKRYFNLDDVEQTYKSLSELKNYKFINIQFTENTDTLTDNPNLSALNCKIELSRMPVHYYNIASELTNSAGNLGIAGNVSYQNKNLFKSAEIFNFKLNAALEAQKIFGERAPDEVIKKLPFNTIETGAEASLELPKFLIPISPENFPKYFRPKTSIKTGFNFQLRPDYTRYILNTSFGYEWKENINKKHILIPIEINTVKIEPDSSFIEIINAIKDKRIQLSYSDHLSMALRYSFIFSNQKSSMLSNFMYFRGNFESSGNSLSLASNFINMEQDELGINKIFKIRYSQYLKADADYRYYNVINNRNSLVFRFAGGFAIPYGNIDVMPFDKSFYAGGANGIRAWKLYDLGPGSYSDTASSKFYKTGDIHLETNIEYRFDIYKYLKGAFFIDMGNIWLRKSNEQFPNAAFKVNEFYKQIAIGSGIGARLDFSFFIIRIDAAIPLRDPQNIPELRWVYNKMELKKVNFNLGIGYPF